ncbi:type II toxin-antitoxin system VapB15 family antitoxin [Pseudopedobacter beijingensis]|uniref:Type II toxin-antitoxin system VapB15 family antitoxin n=1 Tax=Pseudopedobacter beijingensis TaxID=1207056 RepID=A0ABW4IHB0_9SPHI
MYSFFCKFKQVQQFIIKIKTALQIDVSFDQILSMVKQLSKQQKIKLTKELEKEIIDSKLSQLLKVFKNDELDLNIIDAESESVRQEVYDKQKDH